MEPGYEETAFESRIPPPSSSNGMGIAGFVVSLVGILTCGVLCPLGLIFSLVGLGRQPRGLAIAGTVIGGLGSLMLVGFLAVFVIGVGEVKEGMVSGFALVKATAEIEAYQASEGEYPDDDEGNELIAVILDGWDRPFRYERTETGYIIRSAGPDGEFGTMDDIKHVQ